MHGPRRLGHCPSDLVRILVGRGGRDDRKAPRGPEPTPPGPRARRAGRPSLPRRDGVPRRLVRGARPDDRKSLDHPRRALPAHRRTDARPPPPRGADTCHPRGRRPRSALRRLRHPRPRPPRPAPPPHPPARGGRRPLRPRPDPRPALRRRRRGRLEPTGRRPRACGGDRDSPPPPHPPVRRRHHRFGALLSPRVPLEERSARRPHRARRAGSPRAGHRRGPTAGHAVPGRAAPRRGRSASRRAVPRLVRRPRRRARLGRPLPVTPQSLEDSLLVPLPGRHRLVRSVRRGSP